MEIDSNIDRNEHVVFRGNAFDRTVEPNRVVRNHDHDLAVKAVATVATRFHEAVINAAGLLERHHASWDIHVAGEAPGMVHKHHERGILRVTLGDEAGCFLGIVRVQLNKPGRFGQPTLNVVSIDWISSVCHNQI